mmetsp:Transcript_52465/g.170399  ORF Transcript_52465/g.170399 Transcript_52465/m.170399 type:complete len:1092 (+) Transcript_52465:54-3329(+)
MAAPSGASGNGECQFNLRLPFITSDISLSADGREAALATPTGTYVVDLESQGQGGQVRCWRVAGPTLAPAVSRVAFNPHERGQLACASGRSVYIVDVDGDRGGGDRESKAGSIGALKHTYSNNLRPINALDWSPHDPHLLATCAEDCRFFMWDVRQQQPLQTLLAPASWTSCVRWSPLDEFLLATGHEDTVCIWDRRSPSQQMSVLAPGQTRVLGVDWSYHERGKLLSVSAQDAHAPTPEASAEDEAAPAQSATPASSGSGFIKVWDINSDAKVHESIDIEHGLPGTARFMPFGPSILATVDSSVVLFSLPQRGGGRKAQVLQHFNGHAAPVGSVEFARRENGRQWRLLSFSKGERCLRSWRYWLPEEMRSTLVKEHSRSNLLAATESTGPGNADEEEQLLGYLADQAKVLRRIAHVDEVTSYRQTVLDKVEYQLFIEVTTANSVRLRITIGVDPASPAARQALQDAKVAPSRGRTLAAAASPDASDASQGQGLRSHVEWDREWAGTFDGPLAPGVVGQTFRNLDLKDLLRGGGQLRDRVRGLIGMLHRRDGPPQLEGMADAEAQPKASNATNKLPFPRTCGVCWSPQGHLLYFRSLQNVRVPVTRHWTAVDFQSIMKKHKHKEHREVLRDDDDEHTTAAEGLLIDNKVHIVPNVTLCHVVEDHWWTVVASEFLFEPSLAAPRVADVCAHNREAAMRIGREDLAEVWRLGYALAEAAAGTASGLRSRPFANRLVQQILHQLFDAQETLTLAMLGSVLLCLDGPGGRGRAGAASCASPDDARRRPPRRRLPWRPRELKGTPAQVVQGAAPGVSMSQQASSGGERTAFTWSPFSLETAELAKAARSLSGGRGPGAFSGTPWPPSRPGALGQPWPWPRSAENTVTSSPFGCGDFFPGDAPRLPQQPSEQEPTVSHAAPAEGLLELVSQDEHTLVRLLHSAHAHCDLMHRLGQFCAARALAKLLQRFRSYHELPLLDVGEARFGPPPIPCAAEGSVGPQRSPPVLQRQSFALGRSSPVLEAAYDLAQAGEAGRLSSGSAGVCGLCRMRVQSLYTPCWSCSHGFHVSCFRQWFTGANQKCPCIGCECRCLQHRSAK